MEAKLLYGGGGEIHLTAAGTAGTQVYDAGEVLLASAVDGQNIGVVSGSSPIYGGERFTVLTKGVFAIDSASATTFSKGATVDWDNSGKKGVADGDAAMGSAVDAKVSGQTVVNVNLNSDPSLT